MSEPLFADLGPWPVGRYEVRVEMRPRIRLVASRSGRDLDHLPDSVRRAPDFAWIRMLLEGFQQQRRELRGILERVMMEERLLHAADLQMLRALPVGRSLMFGLLWESGGLLGLPWGEPDDEEGLLELAEGEIARISPPLRLPHPTLLWSTGALALWQDRVLRRSRVQPFPQLRRDFYQPEQTERAGASHRFYDRLVRWDQSRALLEGRGWRNVTKAAARRLDPERGLWAGIEFRPALRAGNAYVLLGRVFFLPLGREVDDLGYPGVDPKTISPVFFSEVLRDVALVVAVASRDGLS